MFRAKSNANNTQQSQLVSLSPEAPRPALSSLSSLGSSTTSGVAAVGSPALLYGNQADYPFGSFSIVLVPCIRFLPISSLNYKNHFNCVKGWKSASKLYSNRYEGDRSSRSAAKPVVKCFCPSSPYGVSPVVSHRSSVHRLNGALSAQRQRRQLFQRHRWVNARGSAAGSSGSSGCGVSMRLFSTKSVNCSACSPSHFA